MILQCSTFPGFYSGSSSLDVYDGRYLAHIETSSQIHTDDMLLSHIILMVNMLANSHKLLTHTANCQV